MALGRSDALDGGGSELPTPLEEALAAAATRPENHLVAHTAERARARAVERLEHQQRSRGRLASQARERLQRRSAPPAASTPLPAPVTTPAVPTAERRARSNRAPLGFAVASIALHLALMALLPATPPTALARRPPLLDDAEIRLVPGTGEAITGGRVPDTEAALLTPGGAHPLDHNVDAIDPGVGGDGRGAIEIVLLVPHDDLITLTDAPWNAAGPSQTSRIDVADDRATFEDRRATPSPSDTPFLASGPGEHPERRPVSEVDARTGAAVAPLASTAGMRAEATVAEGATRSEALAGREDRTEAGAAADSPGSGIIGGDGERASEAARVATGRPAVDRGTASTTSEERGRTRDDVDAELLASRPSESLVESSRRAGEEASDGDGARVALGAPGVGGGRTEGGRARAVGTGAGGFEALDTSDARYRRWLLDMQRRLDGAMVFPRARALSMDQGTSVFRVTLRRDGTLVRAPQLIRSSGFRDLDDAALAALESVPFLPLPDDLAPEQERVTVSVPMVWANPMFR